MDLLKLSGPARKVLLAMANGEAVEHGPQEFKQGTPVKRMGTIQRDGRGEPPAFVSEMVLQEIEAAGVRLETYEHNIAQGWKTIVPLPDRAAIIRALMAEDLNQVYGSLDNDRIYVVDTQTKLVVDGPFERLGEIPLHLMGFDGWHVTKTGRELKASLRPPAAEPADDEQVTPKIPAGRKLQVGQVGFYMPDISGGKSPLIVLRVGLPPLAGGDPEDTVPRFEAYCPRGNIVLTFGENDFGTPDEAAEYAAEYLNRVIEHPELLPIAKGHIQALAAVADLSGKLPEILQGQGIDGLRDLYLAIRDGHQGKLPPQLQAAYDKAGDLLKKAGFSTNRDGRIEKQPTRNSSSGMGM